MNLPALTFICGAAKSGRTTLAHAIFDAVPSVQVQSFASPLHDAILGLFFEHAPLDLSDTNDEPMPVLTNETIGGFAKKLENFLVANYGTDVMGRLLAARINDNLEFFERFVIDDCDIKRIMPIRKIVDTIGADNCLIVNLVREGHPYHSEALRSLRCRVINIDNHDSPAPSDYLLNAFTSAFAAPLNVSTLGASAHVSP